MIGDRNVMSRRATQSRFAARSRVLPMLVVASLFGSSMIACARPDTEVRKAEPSNTPSPPSNEPDVAAAKTLLAAGAVLVDVRTPSEFADGHPANAVLVPVDEIEKQAPKLWPQATKLVVVCASGRRATRAAKALRGLGYTNVANGGSVASFMD